RSTISDRDESGPQRHQRFDRGPERLLHLRRLGREEFERDRGVARQIGEQRGIQCPPRLLKLTQRQTHAANSFLASDPARRPSQNFTVSAPPLNSRTVSRSSPALSNQPRI